MTYKEKRAAISRYCTGVESCFECKLKGHCPYDEKDVDDALRIIGLMDNPYWKNVTEIANKQRIKGITEYGQGIEQNTLPEAMDRIEYIEEELVDALMYIEWLKDALKKEG